MKRLSAIVAAGLLSCDYQGPQRPIEVPAAPALEIMTVREQARVDIRLNIIMEGDATFEEGLTEEERAVFSVINETFIAEWERINETAQAELAQIKVQLEQDLKEYPAGEGMGSKREEVYAASDKKRFAVGEKRWQEEISLLQKRREALASLQKGMKQAKN